MRKCPRLIYRICAIAAPTVTLLTTRPASAQILGAADSYGVLAASTVTNTGATAITGNLGVSPGTAITGFSSIDGGPGQFSGADNQGNAAAAQAEASAAAAYTAFAGMSFNTDLTGQNLGGLTLTPGVYHFATSAQLTGTLTLNDLGNPNALFVFEIGSTLTTASGSSVNVINTGGGLPSPTGGVFFQVGSFATLGTHTSFDGNILALTSITLNSGASISNGSALAINGAVSLDDNRIVNVTGAGLTPVPEASTYGIVGTCVLLFAVWLRRNVESRESRPAN
jgi:hypothetical protein